MRALVTEGTVTEPNAELLDSDNEMTSEEDVLLELYRNIQQEADRSSGQSTPTTAPTTPGIDTARERRISDIDAIKFNNMICAWIKSNRVRPRDMGVMTIKHHGNGRFFNHRQ